jgi:hypothetical protein
VLDLRMHDATIKIISILLTNFKFSEFSRFTTEHATSNLEEENERIVGPGLLEYDAVSLVR